MVIWGSIVAVIIVFLVVSWFAPVHNLTPLWVAASRPEFRGFGDKILIDKGLMRFAISLGVPAEFPLFGWNRDGIKYGLNTLSGAAKAGETVYYDIYTEKEMQADPSLRQTGLFVLRAHNDERRPFVLMAAGGGYQSVCTSVESLPVISAFRESGYTSFAVIYRYGKDAQPRTNCDRDIARAIEFIIKHADEFNIETKDYLIGGFSAGGNLVSRWGMEKIGYAKYNLPGPGAMCLIYGASNIEGWPPDGNIDKDYPPCYMLCAGKTDDPAEFGFTGLIEEMNEYGIDYSFKVVDAAHGFGLGLGTPAEGWVNEAEQFWMKNIRNAR